MMKKYHYQKCYETKLPNNDEVNIIHCQRKKRDGATLNVDLPAYVLRVKNPGQDRHTEKWYLFKGPTSKYHHKEWWNLLDSYMGLQHVNAKLLLHELGSATRQHQQATTTTRNDVARGPVREHLPTSAWASGDLLSPNWLFGHHVLEPFFGPICILNSKKSTLLHG